MKVQYYQAFGIVAFCVNAEFALFLVFLFAVHSENIAHDVFRFSFESSMFDLFLICVVRYSMVIGALLGQRCNRRFSQRRLKNSVKFTVYFSCVVVIYTVLKSLYHVEDQHGDKSEWVLFGLTFFSCFSLYIYWELLCAVKFPKSFKSSKSLLINASNGSVNVAGTTSENTNVSESDDDMSDEDSDNDQEEEKDEKLSKIDKELASKLSAKRTVWLLLKMAKNDLFYISIAIVGLIACAAAQIFLPYYTGLVVNYIVIEKSVDKFRQAMLYMALITVAAGFASGIRASFFTFFQARYMTRLQNRLYASIVKMEIGFFDARKTGEITSRLTSDCTKVGQTLGLNINVFLRNSIKVVGVLIFMIKISWKLSIVTLVSIPVIGVISEAFGEKFRLLSEKTQNGLAKANECAEESVSNIRTVRGFAAENHEIKRYDELLQTPYKLYKQEAVITCFYRWSTEVADLSMTLLILFYGGHLVIRNDLEGSSLISFILYSIELGFAFEEIGDVYTGIMEAVGASKNILLYIEREPLIKNEGHIDSGNFNGTIQFKNVSFSYPSRKDVQVLNDVSFDVNKGDIVALVGPSGGGKSSIVNLLERFYEPSSGMILVDNTPLKSYDHHYIHERISLVQQEPVLFARSIAENIEYGTRFNCTQQDINSAAIMANAHSFVEALPKTYQTQTGEKGVQLSGGQKQRIAIARALIRDPSILVLDEATSALDSESEYLVQQAINKNLSGRTVIVIAHRLSTVENADKILVVDKGRIVECGKHNELLQSEGLYANLVKRQLLGVDDTLHKNTTTSNDTTRKDFIRTSSKSSESRSPPKVGSFKGTFKS